MKSRVWCYCVLWLVLLPGLANGLSTDELRLDSEVRALFNQGWSAAAKGDQAGLTEAIDALRAVEPDSTLLPYLQFEHMRQRVNALPAVEMTQFLARYRDWSFHDALERTWLRALGRRGQYALMAAYLDQTGQAPMEDEIACHLAHAAVLGNPSPGSDEYVDLMARIEALWLVGESQHRACDPAFRWWRSQGQPTDELAWWRFLLAIQQNERGLAAYLQRYLNSDQRIWADRWLLMARYPHRALSEARRWPDNHFSQSLVEWGLIKLARQDWQRAQGHLIRLKDQLTFSDAQSHKMLREIALFHALSLDVAALTTIDSVPAQGRDAQLMAWRARVAMAHGQWDEVLASIQAMPISEQASGRWRYWRGRALSALGRPDALLAYASISGEANYYGFLAAKKLGQPLSVCPQALDADDQIRADLLGDPVLRRATALYQVGMLDHARATWFRWLSHLPDAQQHQAALLAAELGWHDRAIATLASTGMMRAYAVRFPVLFEDLVTESTERHGVDPALVYGLMRAESAMQTDARSPVGAMGLLQLMPSTARAVARRQGKSLNLADELNEPETNIALGVAHLAELEARFAGDWRLVAAAYNAGVGAVERWLARPELATDLSPDVWIETLPYFETRDYVPRVLAFATLYEWQLNRPPELLRQHIAQSSPAPPAPSTFVCVAP